jgi:serine/threonine-protein kinase
VRVSVEIGIDASIGASGAPSANLALSPDGMLLAFVATRRWRPGASVRSPPGQLQATVLGAGENVRDPFFSPDGQWIAFFADGKLKKISTTGGAAVTLCDAPAGRGGTWAEDGTIAFVPDSAPETSIFRVSSAGGKAERLTTRADGEHLHRWPQALKGGPRAPVHRCGQLPGLSTARALWCKRFPTAHERSCIAAATTEDISQADISPL